MIIKKTQALWHAIRQLSGDDAYERYLQHYAACHKESGEAALTKAEFFKRWQDSLWNGVKRCC